MSGPLPPHDQCRGHESACWRGKAAIDQIMALMETAFDERWGERWNRRQVEDALAFPANQALLIAPDGAAWEEEMGQAAGFALARHVAGETELLLIAIAPQHRRKGLARRLVELLAMSAKNRGSRKVFLEMRANNEAAGLYRSLGFRPIGRRRDYYRCLDGTRLDAITFCKEI